MRSQKIKVFIGMAVVAILSIIYMVYWMVVVFG